MCRTTSNQPDDAAEPARNPEPNENVPEPVDVEEQELSAGTDVPDGEVNPDPEASGGVTETLSDPERVIVDTFMSTVTKLRTLHQDGELVKLIDYELNLAHLEASELPDEARTVYLIAPGVCLAMLITHLNEREKGVRPADMVKLRAAIKLQNGNITKTDNRTGLVVDLIDDEITSVDVEDDDFHSEDD